MRILVSGGAGFIGSHTVDALITAGHDAVVVDNLSAGKREQLNPSARFYYADLRDGRRVAEIFSREQPEVLFHLAAQMDVRRSVADPVYDTQVNLIGLLNLLEAGRLNGLKRVIFASSGGAIYGEQTQFPCDEDHARWPISPYGVAKLASEQYLFFYRNEYRIDYVALRYANVYGPRQDPHGEAGVVAIFCERLLAGQPCTIYGDGKQTRDYVFVGDVVAANMAALHSTVSGAFNIGTGIETNVIDLHKELSACASVASQPVHAPPRPGEQKRSVISPGRAQRELDWRPARSLRQGLAETYAYFLRRRA